MDGIRKQPRAGMVAQAGMAVGTAEVKVDVRPERPRGGAPEFARRVASLSRLKETATRMSARSSWVRARSAHVLCGYMRDARASASRSAPERPSQDVPLPEAARAFVGSWRQKSVENYENFLCEAVGLGWAMRKIAVKVKPRPTWSIEGTSLHCHVEMIGAKPIDEVFRAGSEHLTVHDANCGFDWDVTNSWEGDELVSVRQAEGQNGGRPITTRRSVSDAGASLVVRQEWSPGKVFTQRLCRG